MNKYLIIFLFLVIAVNGVFAQPVKPNDQNGDQQQKVQKFEEEEGQGIPPVPQPPIGQANAIEEVPQLGGVPQPEGWMHLLWGYCSLL
ncbi:MAG: hypothetical protein LBB44_05660 [Endomicrobium sp.]|jgi:hypothetical protein|nr:hypothetical protein [Endomicrobium sp.]